ncbi:MAG: hypothetical protein IT365_07980 [Candidatus Hydrogenedentes bacterium]|nr:hypothetical protein [Candidatus Hydrogenedentota bacterium]
MAISAIALVAAAAIASAAPPGNLLPDGSFETTSSERPLPAAYSASRIDERSQAEGGASRIEDAHTGAAALSVSRTNTDEGFALTLPALDDTGQSAPRRFALVAWVKRFEERSRASMARITLQAFTREWTGACSTLGHIESNPYANRWSKEAWLLEELPGQRLLRLRWLIDVARDGDRIAFDDLALYDVTGWPQEAVSAVISGETDPISPADIDALPLITANLLDNSSFELGLSGGWTLPPLLPGEQHAAVSHERAQHGERSIALTFAAGSRASLVGRFIRVRPWQTHTVSAWCYAENADTTVTLRFENGYAPDHAPPHRIEVHHVLPAGEWVRMHVSGVVEEAPDSGYALSIAAAGATAGRVWIDSVQVEEGALRGYAPAKAVEFSITPPAIEGILAWDEPLRCTVRAYNYAPEAAAIDARIVGSNFWGTRVLDRPLPAASIGPGLSQYDIVESCAARGSLRCHLLTGDRLEDECTLTVVPPPRFPSRTVESRFGQHVRLEPWQLGVAKRLGAGWVRMHDVENILNWDGVEPERGRYAWHEDRVALAHAAGLEVLGVLGRVPGWMLDPPNPTHGAWVKPSDLDAWHAYAEATARRYSGLVDCWEIWNEPYGSGFAGFTGEAYAALLESASEGVRAGNPGARVVGLCTWDGASEFNQGALAHGARAASDVFSYHVYTQTGEDAYDRSMHLRDQLNAGGQSTPIWMTEGIGGYTLSWHSNVLRAVDDRYSRAPGAPTFTGEAAAVTTAKALANILASGAEKVFFYWSPWEGAGSNQPDRYTWFEYDGQLKPYAAAYAVSAYMLDGTTPVWRAANSEGLIACLFSRDEESVAVVWRQGESTAGTLQPPAASTLSAYDLMGNPLEPGPSLLELSRAPLYLVVKGADPHMWNEWRDRVFGAPAEDPANHAR